MPQDLSSVAGLILAAGKGTRMRSDIPKVLHQIAGKSMLSYVAESLTETGIRDLCTVISQDTHAFQDFMNTFPEIRICIQRERNGTGGAVASAAAAFLHARGTGYAPSELLRGQPFPDQFILICAGDSPAVRSQELRAFVVECLRQDSSLAVLGMEVEDPEGYGRLITGLQNSLLAIVEEKDASNEEKTITLCNSGVIFARISTLYSLLGKLSPDNSQREYYLTDCISMARQEDIPVRYFLAKDWKNFLGVNTPGQLARMEAILKGSAQAT